MAANPERFRGTGLETSEISLRTGGVIFEALQTIGDEAVRRKVKAKNDEERKAADTEIVNIRRFLLNDSIDKLYDKDNKFIGKKGDQAA